MKSEKVKEIKKALECCSGRNGECDQCPFRKEGYDCDLYLLMDALKLINELESENERLDKSDTSKEESSIEYYNLYKDLKRKNKDLNELCELQRVSIADRFVKENQLKDRIAELEEDKEKWQRKASNYYQMAKSYGVECIIDNDIDETLKEFIDD